jgi:serine/threonine-protein kinase
MALEKIGRYEIVGQLGKGAMGVVYRAMDPTIGRTVALKTMRLDVQGPDSSELLARFRNEARLAGVLNHPNIVTIYDAGETGGLFYMAMEYIEGKTLYQLMLQEHALSMETVLDLSRQICAGLDAASAQRVVHRDIKPANIMILPSGTVKITDFGIAKSGGSMTSTGEVLGTPNYMSPEQVKGKPLDGRSDLFSFGVILYEMITGE